VGTAKTNTLIAGDKWDKELLADLSQVMRDASICGLGQTAYSAIESAIKRLHLYDSAPPARP
jgi:formate dehydrogenase